MERRSFLAGGTALAALPAFAVGAAHPAPPGFVRRSGTGLVRDGRPYRFVGANLWYAAWLGADAAYGDRPRLARELDRLAALGVSNLRILAAAEDSPLKGAVSPAFHRADGSADPALLGGLDHALAEIGRRGMTAVCYLTNFWEWSGGMMTYLSWVNGGRFIDMNDPAHPWPAFANLAASFYATPAAVARYHRWVDAIVGRTNGVTGRAYRDDPTIMAWQLANEPRPAGDNSAAAALLPAFERWVAETAARIKAADPHHLVTTGSEGLKGTLEDGALYRRIHALPQIDYLTAHIWPLNWSWIDARDLPGTHAAGLARVGDYLERHRAAALAVGKPLVVEEFGYPRDGGGYDPAATTGYRDGLYRLIYAAVEGSAAGGGPIAGSNFWAWNGEGRAAHGDHRFRPGDTAWLGDPPHEPQGWYGVFNGDASTTRLIAAHAATLARAGAAGR
jgi:mannan endo-1,4-beta-mannosidase